MTPLQATTADTAVVRMHASMRSTRNTDLRFADEPGFTVSVYEPPPRGMSSGAVPRYSAAKASLGEVLRINEQQFSGIFAVNGRARDSVSALLS